MSADPYAIRFYLQYKKLGGKYKTMKKYNKLHDIFIHHTFNNYMGGGYDDKPMYDNREEALKHFKREAKITWEEVYIVFNSIDNVCGYT
ncbi:hypothetical protein [Haliea sp.]|uniref:hypothetical protein n=1 Tax=Haliea sp. TaxID=1932666 RepID=UPI000C43C19E|nr:hypothetical protein [Haliea sp.]MAD62963.1 hypothetical protein [Haliea sp.]|tara:strand:- start:1073 stop:1339 length:267 start_codon:yes stop_codon:yes gene_type:complete